MFRLAKYDSSNEIQIPGYLVDLFSYEDSHRKDYRLGNRSGSKCSVNGITINNHTTLSGVIVTASGGGQVSLASTTWAELAGVHN